MAQVFNRNIITAADISNVRAGSSGVPGLMPQALAVNPPAGVVATVVPAAGAGAVGAAAGVAVPSEDDFMTRLLKFVPLEIVGLYLLLAGVIDSNVASPAAHAWWMASLLVVVAVITVAYDYRVLRIERAGQVAMSVVGITLFVFSAGGWFATTTWWHPWFGSLAVPLFVVLAAILRLKPLNTPDGGGAPPVEAGGPPEDLVGRAPVLEGASS